LSAVATESFRALGTGVAIFVTDATGLEPARAILNEELAAIDRACSRFRDDSELSIVNRSNGLPVRVSELFIEVITVALRVARATSGLVDPTVGRALRTIGYDRDFDEMRQAGVLLKRVRAVSTAGWQTVAVDPRASTVRVPAGAELDLGATAKALTADRTAARVFAEIGVGVLVNLGGDLAIAGDPPAGGWLVRVTEDHSASGTAPGQTVRLLTGGLATSSTTIRRWQGPSGPSHHIVDPRTCESATEVWRTVSVAAGSCVDANAASTAARPRPHGSGSRASPAGSSARPARWCGCATGRRRARREPPAGSGPERLLVRGARRRNRRSAAADGEPGDGDRRPVPLAVRALAAVPG